MPDFRQLTDTMLASPQITAAQLADAKAEGVTLIVNNRPDGEADDQPGGAQIEAAAKKLGLDYRAIPVGGAGMGEAQVDAMADAVGGAQGKVLAYCRSGTRSTLLWSLAMAKRGMDPAAIEQAAAGAGYDLSPIKPAIEMFANARG